jgi:hypothetical protein
MLGFVVLSPFDLVHTPIRGEISIIPTFFAPALGCSCPIPLHNIN